MAPPMLTTAVVATAVLASFSVLAEPGSNYRYSAFFLVPIVWAVYLLRRRAHLHPWLFFLFVTAVVLHDLGTFGFYQKKFAGVWFDQMVHFYFGMVGGLIFLRLLRRGWRLGPFRTAAAAVLFVMGVGAIHELYEWASTLVLGPQRGMLKLPPYGDATDTHRDLFANLLGVLLSLVLYAVFPQRRADVSVGR
jgi:uncharacterized membrane protein YjdF